METIAPEAYPREYKVGQWGFQDLMRGDYMKLFCLIYIMTQNNTVSKVHVAVIELQQVLMYIFGEAAA